MLLVKFSKSITSNFMQCFTDELLKMRETYDTKYIRNYSYTLFNV